jgi:hypothetical protein
MLVLYTALSFPGTFDIQLFLGKVGIAGLPGGRGAHI